MSKSKIKSQMHRQIGLADMPRMPSAPPNKVKSGRIGNLGKFAHPAKGDKAKGAKR